MARMTQSSPQILPPGVVEEVWAVSSVEEVEEEGFQVLQGGRCLRTNQPSRQAEQAAGQAGATGADACAPTNLQGKQSRQQGKQGQQGSSSTGSRPFSVCRSLSGSFWLRSGLYQYQRQ